MDIIKSIEHEQLKSKIPDIKIGDTVRVHQRVKEGNRERIQVFEGIVIKKQNGGLNETFTVRRISYGVGVEKTFLIHSPLVEKVELVRVGKVRRAKLYYLRDRIGKAAKTKENVGANLKREQIIVKEEAEKAREIEEEKKAEKAAEAKAEETKTAETTEAKTVEKAEAKTAEKAEAKTAEKAEAKATDTKTTEPKAE
jgi:large subunit ribosomal protein L19